MIKTIKQVHENLQGSDCATEQGASTSKNEDQSGSSNNKVSCWREEVALHVCTDTGIRGTQRTMYSSLTICVDEVRRHGIPYPSP